VIQEHEKLLEAKKKQIESTDKEIQVLKSQLSQLDSIVGAQTASKETRLKVRRLLFEISISLQDFFSDYEIPDSDMDDFQHLAGEMEKGSAAFQAYLNGGQTETIEWEGK
jgi:hypothetical protein